MNETGFSCCYVMLSFPLLLYYFCFRIFLKIGYEGMTCLDWPLLVAAMPFFVKHNLKILCILCSACNCFRINHIKILS